MLLTIQRQKYWKFDLHKHTSWHKDMVPTGSPS